MARIKTNAAYSNKITKSITVTTDSKEQPQLHLRVSFEAYSVIEARPYPHITFQAYAGESVTKRLLLHRADGKPLKVKGVKLEGQGDFEITAEPVGKAGEHQPELKAEPGDLWLIARATAPTERVSYRAMAKVEVEHPELDVMSIPVTLMVTPLIEPAPRFARLWLAEEGSALGSNGRSVTSTLRHRKNLDFEISDIEVSHPDLFEATRSSEGAQKVHTLVLRLLDDVDRSRVASPVRAKVMLKTSEQEVPELEIDVMISQSRSITPPRDPGQRRGQARDIRTRKVPVEKAGVEGTVKPE